LWIVRIQAGARQYRWNYSRFVPALQQSGVRLNRKVLADLCANEPFAFKAVVDVVNHYQQQEQKKENVVASNGGE
jgi:large subunit ribosomal protein L20